MSVRAETGQYDRSKMVSASGGIELLGPEYETQPDPHSDVEQAQP